MRERTTERMRLTTTPRLGIATTSPSYTLHVNGYVRGTSSYVSASDGRWKENVEPLRNALGLLKHLVPVTYEWRRRGNKPKYANGTQVGFIAQEVQQVVPDAVQERDDGYKTMQASKLTAVAVGAVAELDRKIRQQTADSWRQNSAMEAMSQRKHHNGDNGDNAHNALVDQLSRNFEAIRDLSSSI